MDEKPNIVYNFLNALVTKVHAIAGQAITELEILDFMVTELKKDVLTRFKGLTLQEVEIALTNGVKGDYGEYYGLNVKSFNKFLNAYTFSEERSKALSSRLTPVTPEKQLSSRGTITREENERVAIENAFYTFEEYKRSKQCFDPGNCVYDFLDRLKLIKFTPADKWKFMEEAKKQRETERKFLGKTMLISDVIEKQQEGGIIVAYAKKIALKRYFDDLVNNEVELKAILDEKKERTKALGKKQDPQFQ